MAVTSYNPTILATPASGHLQAAVPEYWAKKGLTTLWPSLLFVEFAREGGDNAWLKIKAHNGKKVHFFREPVPSASACLTALVESADDPTPDTLALGAVTAVCGEYGKHSVLSDWAQGIPIIQGIDIVARAKAFQAVRAFNTLLQIAISTNGTARFAGTSKVSANEVMSTDVLSRAELEVLAFYMHANNVRPYPDGRYKMVIHPACTKDVRADTAADAMFSLLKYTLERGKEEYKRFYVGDMSGFKIMESTEINSVDSATISGTSGYGYFNIWGGYEGVGAVSIAGSNVLPTPPSQGTGQLLRKSPMWDPRQSNLQIIIKTPGRDSTDNPLNRRATVAWKFVTVAKVLDSARCGYLLAGSANASTG